MTIGERYERCCLTNCDLWRTWHYEKSVKIRENIIDEWQALKNKVEKRSLKLTVQEEVFDMSTQLLHEFDLIENIAWIQKNTKELAE